MEYRRLGSSGLKVSPLSLSAMMFGGAADEASSLRIVDSLVAPGRPSTHGYIDPVEPVDGRVPRSRG